MTIKLIKGCIGCGTCVKTCPTDFIRQDAKTKKAIIAYPADCQMIGQFFPVYPGQAIIPPIKYSWTR